MTIRSAYLADEALDVPLAEDLARRGVTIERWHHGLALSTQPPVETPWALDIWTDPRTIAIGSIGEAARALRAIQRNWAHQPGELHRRSALIAAALPPVKAAALRFPQAAPTAPLGAWTLLEPGLLLASPTRTSPFAAGVCRFEEDRTGPPSRAYLKLWEALARLGYWPLPGERCVDLGASPGGWSWALATLGAEVISVDRAPLDPAVASLPNVTVRQESAFGIEPFATDWLFSDIIAYPQRLHGLLSRWIDSALAPRIVCTIKYQGSTDHAATDALAALPGARLLHLSHNRHELTFFRDTTGGPAR
ncbi:23S rRNA (cytidine2498-2'-O)-methyltransferase [Endobacter medicaginis]|uniref:23S rRNA (Cytidine2498-2'-O)-methyltransferase n=3 Tax=Endobacter medicaginis TaxID=1181271 RepID=A0A839UY67_9PROT|nr:SAM-dependent methyltransferase [Endobacter medicaginis]MBB3174716.1 23S rRNA (cytidine2498-2'-O)-methyltransferase [Endobacter medicaginis]MCX5474889.1 hypothetical protein [Endobacter medicaginis]